MTSSLSKVLPDLEALVDFLIDDDSAVERATPSTTDVLQGKEALEQHTEIE